MHNITSVTPVYLNLNTISFLENEEERQWFPTCGQCFPGGLLRYYKMAGKLFSKWQKNFKENYYTKNNNSKILHVKLDTRLVKHMQLLLGLGLYLGSSFQALILQEMPCVSDDAAFVVVKLPACFPPSVHFSSDFEYSTSISETNKWFWNPLFAFWLLSECQISKCKCDNLFGLNHLV